MREYQCEHFVNSIVYLMEQTTLYCKTKGAQFFENLNIGISLEQYTILDTLSFNSGICQRELSRLILKDRSFTSRLLNSLEDGGYVERRIEAKGKRLVKELYLTSKGQDIIDEYQEKLKSLFLYVFNDISEEEFSTVRAGLEKMKTCMSKHTELSL